MDRKALIYKGFPPNCTCCDGALRILPGGEMVAIFMTGGTREPEPDNHIVLCRSSDEGETWGEPELVQQFPDRGCTLSEVYLHDGRLTLLFMTHGGSFDAWTNYTSTSDDGGRTWSSPEPFEPAPQRTFVRNRVIASWGEWLFPTQSYNTVDDPTPSPLDDGSFKTPFCYLLISGDAGKTFDRSTDITPCRAWAEPTLVELSDERLVMLIRADGTGCLHRSDSTDRGRTWSPVEPTDIPNPGSKARLHRLSDGRIILIHNPTSVTGHSNNKHAAQVNRNPLSLWISDDEMQSWTYRRDLTDFPGMLAYPDGEVSADEQYLHFAFDYNRHDLIYWGAHLSATGEM